MKQILQTVEAGAEFTLLPMFPGFRAILALPGSGPASGHVYRADGRTVDAALAGIIRQLPAAPLRAEIEQVERTKIMQTVELCAGDKEQAAKRLGISVATLYRKIQN